MPAHESGDAGTIESHDSAPCLRLIGGLPGSFRALEHCSVALESRVILREGMVSMEPEIQGRSCFLAARTRPGVLPSESSRLWHFWQLAIGSGSTTANLRIQEHSVAVGSRE
jgi:hypothetical protein